MNYSKLWQRQPKLADGIPSAGETLARISSNEPYEAQEMSVVYFQIIN